MDDACDTDGTVAGVEVSSGSTDKMIQYSGAMDNILWRTYSKGIVLG